MMGSRKVGIVGAGFVGATAAYSLALMGTCHEVILYDINIELAEGKAIDIGQSTPYSPQGTIVRAAQDASDLQGCDVIVITAGVPRKSEMTRADLLMINANIMKDVVSKVIQYSPDAIILCVSNPLDVMTYVIHKMTGWNRNRIIGMAGALDGARMAYQIQQKVGYGSGQTRAMIIGEHGENMIPMPEISAVGGVPLNQIISKEDMIGIIERTRDGGAQIVKRLGTSAYYAPGRAISIMVEAILDDSRIVMPSCVMLDGEYGYKDITVGVPIVLGHQGVERIIELELDDETKVKFKDSVDSIQDGIDILTEQGFFQS
jgi:malate dehydrogenase